MNYYSPNYYTGGYPQYSNQYPLPTQFSPPSNFQMPQPVNNQPQQTNIGLNGKIVDSEDVVKATEVPIGGYGIFPKADLSEIYIKSWNNNGTTSVITFRPVIPETKIEQPDTSIQIIERLNILNAKLDNLISCGNQVPVTTQVASAPKKKEVNVNDY